MKKQIRMASLALTTALFAVSAGAAVAAQAEDGGNFERKHRMHGAGMHLGGDPQRMVQHLTRELELDETQQQEIENIVTAAKPEIEALRDRVEANMKAMHELDVNDSDYYARLNELAAEKGAIASEQALLHGRLKAEINGALTPEQRQQLADKGDRMRDRFKQRKQQRAPGEGA